MVARSAQRTRNKKLSTKLRKIINSYLEDREVKYKTKYREIKKQITKGCTQGSILGPLLWNVLFNSGFLVNIEEIAFADDPAIIIKGDTRKELEERTQEVLDLVGG